MIEEMYKEEFGGSQMNCNLSSENTLKGKRDDVQEFDNDKSEESQDNLIAAADSVQPGQQASSTTELDSGGKNVMDSGSRKLQQGNQRFSMNNNSLYSSGGGTQMASTPATYDLSELGNFTVGSHVSLALELRNCESDGFAMSDDATHKRHNQTLASSSAETDLLDYHFTDSGKQQHRFGNPHLLHEFVV